MLTDEKQYSAEELAPRTKMTKVDRYEWGFIDDAPGRFDMVKKGDLNIDVEHYQRLANQSKVLAIAKDWSWVSCGALIVACRMDGSLWVIDGQHRKVAADKRADIPRLPCIIFNVDDVVSEAKGFLSANTLRKPMGATEKFKAEIACGDEITLKAKRLIDQTGRTISRASSATTFGCVTALKRVLKEDEAALLRIWPLAVKVSAGHIFNERILQGLFYIERNLADGESLSNRRWASRVEQIGYDGLISSIQKAGAYFGKGGAKIHAEGILQAINFKLQKQLKLKDRTG